MRKHLFTLVFTTCLVLPCVALPQAYSYPESAEFYEPANLYFVSNQGHGRVLQTDGESFPTTFCQDFYVTKGLMILGDTLFVSAGTQGLAAYDLNPPFAQLFWVTFPGMNELNDVAADSSGNVYVSDAQGNKIHRLRLSDMSTSTIVTGFAWANGLSFDQANNRLLACQWIENSPISAISLDDYSVTVVRDDGLDLLDGLTRDNEGRLYVSSFGSDMVHRYDPDLSGPPAVVAVGFNNPGDIYYNKRDEILVVPNIGASRVDFVSFYDPDHDFIMGDVDNCPDHYNPLQEDRDNDGIGDVCDECTDPDEDGYGDPDLAATTCEIDNCPEVFNYFQWDFDADGVGNACDNCEDDYNPGQEDADGDGLGDVCDCCQERVGDANGVGGDEPTIGDVSVLIDAKFITGTCDGILNCFWEADINQSGGITPTCDHITIGDISTLIDYLFITGTPLGLAECL